MSYDPNGQPPRPRSTPIPDPDHPGQFSAPPTPAQFLDEQLATPMPPPPPAPGAMPAPPPAPMPGPLPGPMDGCGGGYGGGYGGMPFAPSVGGGVSGLRRVRTIVGLVVGMIGLAIGLFTLLRARNAIDAATAPRHTPVTIPAFTIPTFTIPTFTVPSIAVPQAPVIPGAGSTAPVVTAPETAPPTVVTEPATTALPGGVASLFEGAAAHAVADQLDAAIPGDPTQFTQILLYPDYAIATGQDPADPTKSVGALWRDGAATDATVETLGGSDSTNQTFTEADLNWDAIAPLAAQAPDLLGAPGGTVSHIIIDRSPFDPAQPLTIRVYVDGGTGGSYVEAGADGSVLGTH